MSEEEIRNLEGPDPILAALSRREWLRRMGLTVGLVGFGQLLAACQPAVAPSPTSAPKPTEAAKPSEAPKPAAPPQSEIDNLKGSGTATIADPGGPFTEAFAKGYHEPFRRLSGINTQQIPREHEPVAQVKAQVESGRALWDATILSLQAYKALSDQQLLEPLQWDTLPFRKNELMPEAVKPDWMGTDVFTAVIGWRKDKFPNGGPQSWADFFDLQKFPGRRGMYRSPLDTFEEALLADGVPADQLYPLDVDRALRKLSTIKPQIVWWSGGAQATQMIKDGEVEIVATWNARIQAAIDEGAPIEINWSQGIFSIEGFGIPKGAPNREQAQKFIAFASWAENMAEWTKHLAYGPTNPRAYDLIPPERARLLPTSPENRGKIFLSDFNYWAENFTPNQERLNTWLLQG
jgi:putative spermidine/putrescine transport system substrate-binding protein